MWVQRVTKTSHAPSRDADDNARSSARIFSCEVLIKILIFTITLK